MPATGAMAIRHSIHQQHTSTTMVAYTNGQLFHSPCNRSTPIPHEKLVDAMKAFLAIEPGIEETGENKKLFKLINKYFNPAVHLSAPDIGYLYKQLHQRLQGSAIGTLAEEYIDDLGIAPFDRYEFFSLSGWLSTASTEKANLWGDLFSVVDKSSLFADLYSGSSDPPAKAIQYIAAAMAEYGITPGVGADRIDALIRGSRLELDGPW
ncbi:hypothetical protein BDN71DRAFT_1512360 [Pleurotus eryngii]|uniref:Uncharacterized protein n=1 Tax=Pleurotus eryngii TaxID=5323 RepID=A0A9P5ZKT2_PLEER|nr:hypothetical protein BDN71DRAFT_1512360 [Pleurotus eryngii]